MIQRPKKINTRPIKRLYTKESVVILRKKSLSCVHDFCTTSRLISGNVVEINGSDGMAIKLTMVYATLYNPTTLVGRKSATQRSSLSRKTLIMVALILELAANRINSRTEVSLESETRHQPMPRIFCSCI